MGVDSRETLVIGLVESYVNGHITSDECDNMCDLILMKPTHMGSGGYECMFSGSEDVEKTNL
tara:strand:+ start:168 stop:353 length:186 start_codon:yes stop_codon:yes gene_type:complete